jgi:hypothetical protein
MSAFNRLWNHPAGPKTIFFWAPAMKWALVAAAVGDMKKPVEVVSTNQNLALAATGLIWSRYATQITPVNYSLLLVNMFVAATALYQLSRKYQAGQLYVNS